MKNKSTSVLIFCLLFALSILFYRLRISQPPFIAVIIASNVLVLLVLASPRIMARLEQGGLPRSMLLAELYRDALFLPFIALPLARVLPYPKITHFVGILLAFTVGSLGLYAYKQEVIGKREVVLWLISMILVAWLHFWIMS